MSAHEILTERLDALHARANRHMDEIRSSGKGTVGEWRATIRLDEVLEIIRETKAARRGGAAVDRICDQLTVRAKNSGETCLSCGRLLTWDDDLSSSPDTCAKCRAVADREFFGAMAREQQGLMP